MPIHVTIIQHTPNLKTKHTFPPFEKCLKETKLHLLVVNTYLLKTGEIISQLILIKNIQSVDDYLLKFSNNLIIFSL